MADLSDDDFGQTGDSGASTTFPQQASAIRKNGHIIIKGHPCKVVEMSTSKTGKHGHAKIHFVALDIFTGKKYEDIVPSTHNTSVPHVKRTEYQLVDISDGFLSLMDEGGDTREDVRLPDNDLGKEIQTKFENDEGLLITVLKAMDSECAMSVKPMPSK